MCRALLYILCLCVSFLSLSAHADENDCTAQAGSHADALNCVNSAIEVQIQKQEQLLQDLKASFPKQQRQLLAQTQKYWEEYRDMNCQLRSLAYTGGNISVDLQRGCLLETFQKRNETLDSLSTKRSDSSPESSQAGSPARLATSSYKVLLGFMEKKQYPSLELIRKVSSN